MRFILIVFLLSIAIASFAQLREGFDTDEVKACIAMCNSYTFQDLYQSDSDILPKGYQKVYTSEVAGMDNMFQIYKKDKVGVINFRGSTAKVASWVENMFSAMIPAQGVFGFDETEAPYCFAKDTSAAVHSGYALAVVLLSPMLLDQIEKLNTDDIYNIIITGHSQGGALANLSRAYLENLPEGKISSDNIFKTYAFANPMCGNKEFAEEYQARYCETNMSYSIINPVDFVPQMPMHYQDEGPLISPELMNNWIQGKEAFDIRKIGINFVLRKSEPLLSRYITSSNTLIEKFVSKSYSSVKMPAYTGDINYYQTGTIRTLQPFRYPSISEMTEEQLEKLELDENGNYIEKEPSFFQHKPYNYYVAILKEYHSQDYNNLTMMYLPENL